jgi:hypothetical protein
MADNVWLLTMSGCDVVVRNMYSQTSQPDIVSQCLVVMFGHTYSYLTPLFCRVWKNPKAGVYDNVYKDLDTKPVHPYHFTQPVDISPDQPYASYASAYDGNQFNTRCMMTVPALHVSLNVLSLLDLYCCRRV